jgi:hypothetical protein
MISAHGNDAVIDALEKLLAHARRGKAGYLIAVMVTDGEKPTGGWFGSPPLERSAMVALEQMAGMMERTIVNKTMPPAPAAPADQVCYNVPMSPCSYDFIHWLVDAEMTRIAEGAPAPLKVCFWFGRDGKTGLEDPWRRGMLENVMRPALALIGAVEDNPTAINGRCKMEFGFKDVVDGARRGLTVPRFRAPKEWPYQGFSGGAVTITLREAKQWPHRNSDRNAWLKFAHHLRALGELVVIIRDTAYADEGLDVFPTCPGASYDLTIRAALYQSAKMNFFVSNGPATLAFFSEWSWTMFLKIEPDGHPYAPNTPSFWREQFGMEVGEQFPWARPDQRIVWKGDDYENLVEAWEAMNPAVPA